MAVSKGRRSLKEADEAIDAHVESLQEDIERLEKKLKPYYKLKERIDQLRAAQRALLGGSRTTGEGTARVRQEDIVRFLADNPGSTPGEIGEALGAKQGTISSALYRGKGERFLTRDRKWWLRDPKNGIKTIDDVEEE